MTNTVKSEITFVVRLTKGEHRRLIKICNETLRSFNSQIRLWIKENP